jgi:hypothetical protein
MRDHCKQILRTALWNDSKRRCNILDRVDLG